VTRSDDFIWLISRWHRERELIKGVPKRELARAAHIARRTVDAAHAADEPDLERNLKRMAAAAETIRAEQGAAAAEHVQAIEWVRRMAEEKGLAWLANTIGQDKSNIAKMVRGQRKIPNRLVRLILARKSGEKATGEV
jgi:hypothetical protein